MCISMVSLSWYAFRAGDGAGDCLYILVVSGAGLRVHLLLDSDADLYNEA